MIKGAENLRPFLEEDIDGGGRISLYAVVPDLITGDLLKEMEVPQLLSQGYGFDLPDNQLLEYAEQVYGSKNTITYFALSEGKAVGSATFSMLIRDNGSQRADSFWDVIEEGAPSLLRKIEALSDDNQPFAVHEEGIVTLPDWRQKGVQKKLVAHALTQLEPSLIVGETRSPATALLIAKLSGEEGYETFFGGTNIKPDTQFSFQLPSSVSKAHLSLLPEARSLGRFLFFPGDMTQPAIPEYETLNNPIRNVFESLARYQTIHQDRTFYLPLVSMKKRLLV